MCTLAAQGYYNWMIVRCNINNNALDADICCCYCCNDCYLFYCCYDCYLFNCSDPCWCYYPYCNPYPRLQQYVHESWQIYPSWSGWQWVTRFNNPNQSPAGIVRSVPPLRTPIPRAQSDCAINFLIIASYNYLQLWVITLTTECIEFLRSMCTLAAQGYYNWVIIGCLSPHNCEHKYHAKLIVMCTNQNRSPACFARNKPPVRTPVPRAHQPAQGYRNTPWFDCVNTKFVIASYNHLQLWVVTLTTECIEFLRSMCTLAAQGYYNWVILGCNDPHIFLKINITQNI